MINAYVAALLIFGTIALLSWAVYRAICKISLSGLSVVSDLVRMQDSSNREALTRLEASFLKTLEHLQDTQMANGTPVSYLVAERDAAMKREEAERKTQHELQLARLETQRALHTPRAIPTDIEPDTARAMGD